MKTIATSFLQAILFCTVTVFFACSQDIAHSTEEILQQPITLQINLSKTGFDDPDATRSGGTGASWEDGEVIYLRFTTSAGIVSATVTYKASTADWTLTYQGSLTAIESAKVTAYYFDQPSSSNNSNVMMAATTAVYHDANGIYSCSTNGDMKMTLNLKPITGRLRFKGKSGTTITLNHNYEEFSYYYNYYIPNGMVSRVAKSISLTVGNNGYTPYIYGLVDDSLSSLRISYGEYTDALDYVEYTYALDYAENMLQVGKSGWLTIPQPPLLCPDAKHPHMIDMGMSFKISCCNLGAKTPIEYGDYYAWGETVPKTEYKKENYKWYDTSNNLFTKYCVNSSDGIVDNKTQLELNDDAAYVNWGVNWRMPTYDEFKTLISNCTYPLINWITINDVRGILLKAKNGNTIFLPATGYMIEKYNFHAGSDGWYLSSSLSSNTQNWWASSFRYGESDTRTYFMGYHRYDGITIRPISTN